MSQWCDLIVTEVGAAMMCFTFGVSTFRTVPWKAMLRSYSALWRGLEDMRSNPGATWRTVKKRIMPHCVLGTITNTAYPGLLLRGATLLRRARIRKQEMMQVALNQWLVMETIWIHTRYLCVTCIREETCSIFTWKPSSNELSSPWEAWNVKSFIQRRAFWTKPWNGPVDLIRDLGNRTQ